MAAKTFKFIRSITSNLRRYVSNRRRALRRVARFEARLPFIITLLGTGRGRANGLRGEASLIGHTRDLSETGLTLLLPSVRVGDAYLTDGESRLNVRLELPGGPVEMLATSARFEQLQRKEAGCSYLLAIHIVKMQSRERERYLAYLKTIKSKERRQHERREVHAAAFNGANSKAQSSTWEALTPASINSAFEKFLRE